MTDSIRKRATRSDKGKKRPKVADISSKHLISLVPNDWLRWATNMPNIKVLEVLEADFQWISRQSDALIKAETPELGQFLVLNEFQLRYTDKMPTRMNAYTGLAREKSGLPVYPILVNILPPSDNTEIGNRYEEEFLGKKTVQEYHVINLWEIDAQIAFSQKPLLPFVPIMKGGNDEKVIQKALNELRADEKLKELEMTLAFFASFVLSSNLIQQIMRWDMAVLRESPWYRQIISEGIEIGREEGRDLGHKEGRDLGHKEGFQEGKRQAVLQLLAARFGPASPKVKGQIQAISDIAFLDQLFSDALTFASYEQFEQSLSDSPRASGA